MGCLCGAVAVTVAVTSPLSLGEGVGLLNGPVDRPWGMRTASFTDPGGHIWELATRQSALSSRLDR